MLEKLFRPILTALLRLCFGVTVSGLEHYRAAGDKVLVISNHQSYLDPLLIAVLLPEKPAFAINVFQAQKWYFGWLGKVVKLYQLDPARPMLMKRLIRDMRTGTKVVLFPEGRITTSGGLMKIYDGTGMILEKTGATLLPLRIDGADYSKLSRLGRKLRQHWFPHIRLTFLPPQHFETGKHISSSHIYDIMTQGALAGADCRRPILAALLEASELHGSGHIVGSDMKRIDMSYRTLFTRGFVLGGKLRAPLDGQTYVGVMLPSSLAAMVTFVSLHMLAKIPCMLNFSAGAANVVHACRIAGVRTVLTSRAFVEQGKLEALIEALQAEYTVVYLEDVAASVSLTNKLSGLYKAIFAHEKLYKTLSRVNCDEPAVILYTSGSEGTPKGVALSHANLLSNIAQTCSRLDITPADAIFNALPVFHSFGLMAGMLMPMLRGVRTFLYPTPLHYRVIPELVYDTDSTIMLGTDTFYKGYAHYAHPYDFWRVRLAVAGAEQLKESTRQYYAEHFRTQILEGYGVTEAGPVLSVNTPMEHKAGTVGRALPGIECKLEPVAGLESGGRLLVRGPNIMLGYLDADKPGTVKAHAVNPVGSASDSTRSCAITPQFAGLTDEWYDTGDIVDFDAEGYISILGRAKRFAKIGGEMVSLLAVEDMASTLLPEHTHAAINVADPKKGEHIILYTESPELTREQLMRHARQQGIAEIFLPRHVLHLEGIPRLGNGKIDYPALAKDEYPKR